MSCNLRPLVRVVQGREHRVPSVVRAVPSKASLVPQMPESSWRRPARWLVSSFPFTHVRTLRCKGVSGKKTKCGRVGWTHPHDGPSLRCHYVRYDVRYPVPSLAGPAQLRRGYISVANFVSPPSTAGLEPGPSAA